MNGLAWSSLPEYPFIGIKGDVTKMEDLERIFKDTFDRFGKIDAVVINARV